MKSLLDFSDRLEVIHIELNLPRLSPAFDGYRIAQLSDIHLGEWQNEKRWLKAVRAAVQQAPDLIVLTGDYVSIDPPQYEAALREGFSELSAPDGVLAVLGNHDHRHDPDLLRGLMRAHGVQELQNLVVSICRNGSSLHIAGVDSAMREKADLSRVIQQLPEEGSAILLAHEPGFATLAAAAGRFDAQFSGHSHGGQICFPGIGPVFFPRMGKPYSRGLYRIQGMIQYTNRGVGLGHLPVRLNCPAELSLFTLRAADRGA
jgi:hypothetical protein